jgi:5-(carboxyamino)imidazole ribonucleotide synthase
MSGAKTLRAPVPPGGTIGILGGGQLGRMLALAAARLGLRTIIYSDERDAPANQVTSSFIYVASTTNRENLADFARHCDAITYEFENIPHLAVETLSEMKPVYPSVRALTVTQDRLSEKTFLRELGMRIATYWPYDGRDDDDDTTLDIVGAPAIFKTRKLGYDGKGQAKVRDQASLREAWLACGPAPGVVESVVDFAFEASVIAARGMDGSFAAYDPPENAHENHILRRSTVPGRLTAAQSAEAKTIARKIADALDYVGVLAVELFVARDGTLLVNEIAPRVHNSGHWTLEACAVSQFEQHIRAVAGWPLGDPARHADAVMENIIGEEAADWETYARRPGALHLYGKDRVRPGRKMGHFTTLRPLTKS